MTIAIQRIKECLFQNRDFIKFNIYGPLPVPNFLQRKRDESVLNNFNF